MQSGGREIRACALRACTAPANETLPARFVLRHLARGKEGAGLGWLRRNGTAAMWISPVTLAEVLEGADDPVGVKDYLRRYSRQGIHRVHGDLVATSQRRASRPMGENDAWQAAVAQQMGAI